MGNLKIFAGNSNPEFAQNVAKHGGFELGKCNISRFADGEIQVEIQESVRGSDCYIISKHLPTCKPKLYGTFHNY